MIFRNACLRNDNAGSAKDRLRSGQFSGNSNMPCQSTGSRGHLSKAREM